MALSEQERKLLEQLERSLMADDPTFAESLRGSSTVRVHRRRATLAGLGFVAGVVVLIGCLQISPWLSVLGFVIMLVAAVIGINAWQRVPHDEAGPEQEPAASATTRKPKSREQEFMERLEEQWRRKHGDDKD